MQSNGQFQEFSEQVQLFFVLLHGLHVQIWAHRVSVLHVVDFRPVVSKVHYQSF